MVGYGNFEILFRQMLVAFISRRYKNCTYEPCQELRSSIQPPAYKNMSQKQQREYLYFSDRRHSSAFL